MNQSKQELSNWLLILSVITLAVAPLIFIRDAEFGGADGQAEEAIVEVQPGYEPWFKPVFEPPSGEVESLLFTSQAALGSGVIGYVIGLYKERFRQKRNKE
ncbi:energy-coupling factor ABC transporter substrate-binding protein [Umezakia ovalisporum]|jgi:cobalt/nickel transport protein|uniref:Cobalt transport protein CbiN n=2 Tax=Umezakia ovalisporum TaxID=75695 RepID=A0AA43GVJ0_9CYAN|nr:energy-coupling factor ABC transporter substrate-binding protein [Umezakia ovalisporum]MDH6057319.1 energy-coupling factor ABC transporter substrate-binding protein [Umezakia ovalisporum FSS-43]MDH6062395.1 energy-coupling factor ABC transporter substrate-binding protein [Umezakia ovalisporum FSS-62]MDH6069143.1 energy-coupling factor ABC transporter substrate-binding protein [Umezakia ovalisporum APH033B]MDH6072741.1 energy-coupling factor ABC transporter substrate-binding protein [Umezakia